MLKTSRPFSASARVSDPDFEGVICALGPDWRLAVNMACDKYLLQRRGQFEGGDIWVAGSGRAFASADKLVAKFGGVLDGLADVCSGLPSDPAQAVPLFSARRSDFLERLRLRQWRWRDYARALRTDANLRLVVDRQGSMYAVQWISRDAYLTGPSDDWRYMFGSSQLADIRRYMLGAVADISEPWFSRDPVALVARVDQFLAGFPAVASHGVWADLPELP